MNGCFECVQREGLVQNTLATLYSPEPAWAAGEEDHSKVWALHQRLGRKSPAIRSSRTEVESGHQDSEPVQVRIQDAKRSFGIGHIADREPTILKVERE